MNKTKIICTLGPSSYDKETLRKLIHSGLNVARFNFSHAEYEQSRILIQNIKDLNKELKSYVGFILDTKGPEIRTHQFDGLVSIKKNSLVKIYSEEVLGNCEGFSVTYKDFYKEINVGNMIYVDDGYLSLEVIDKDLAKKELITRAKNDHNLKSRRGINVPNVKFNIDFISPKDYHDILFAIEEDYDYIAASFVRSAKDIQDIKNILKENKNDRIQIIAKIENQEGIDNLDEIIDISDGIMVARGDLGIEIPGEKVPLYQTKIIFQCLLKGKIVVVATQMLESMQKNPHPTKAEISDVFNAVREGTVATMLSGESASGDYPIESVQYMSKINYQAEKNLDSYFLSHIYQPQNSREYLLLSVVEIAFRLNAKAIIVDNFQDAYNISKFHPSVCVLALLSDLKEASLLSLSFSIIPILNQEELNKKISFLKNKNDNYFLLVKKQTMELKIL
ncbi:pyruvate kinase [Candidatus Phytoplasma pini]|uniref:Pyruvate kinase n=1 Tax=Candidatus Phytoplasma pini TaxID=267362 RepID=A0A559KJK1_9MOLU|nr:pyruvate kinase [Candidatus Phytoplasma pini]TVY12287.1 pyruvate kinase [Candidatus Phytoplasma pini]